MFMLPVNQLDCFGLRSALIFLFFSFSLEEETGEKILDK